MSQELIEKIKQLAAQYDNQKVTDPKDNVSRFKALVDKHGIELVSAATGLTEMTIMVYYRQNPTRSRYPSAATVEKAEHVLSQI